MVRLGLGRLGIVIPGVGLRAWVFPTERHIPDTKLIASEPFILVGMRAWDFPTGVYFPGPPLNSRAELGNTEDRENQTDRLFLSVDQAIPTTSIMS